MSTVGEQRSIETAEELLELLDTLNERGEAQVSFPVLDRVGVFLMAFGEERSEGGEAMTCWLHPANPTNGDIDHPEPSCDECGQYREFWIPLDDGRYPMVAWLNDEQAAVALLGRPS